MLSTEMMLLARYGSPIIPLAECCQEITGLSYKKTCEAINLGKWPFPVTRAYDSIRAPYLVHITDLAKFLDETFEAVRSDFGRLK